MTPKELQFCSYIEQEFRVNGELPGYDKVADRLGLGSHNEYLKYWESKDVREYLSGVGLDVERILAGTTEVLTPLQLLCINSLLDTNDKRTDQRKLKELGIKTKTWDQWKSDPAFAAYYAKRIAKLLEGVEEIDRTLFERARDGDVSAIKFFNEVTGRYRPQIAGNQSAGDFRLLIIRLTEVLTRHLADDPEKLHAIGLELEALADSAGLNDTGNGRVIQMEPKRQIGF